MHTLPTILSDCWLFRGLDTQEISAVLGCIAAQQHTYPKHSFIFHAGDCVTRAGIVVRGELHIVREDIWGNRAIQAVCRPADCLPVSPTTRRMSLSLPRRIQIFYFSTCSIC